MDAIDYLLKPFDLPRFLKAINKAFTSFLIEKPTSSLNNSSQDDFLFVKDGRDLVKVQLDNILYIKGQKDYVMFITKSRKIMSLMNMKDLEQDLIKKAFVRIHQSYIINTQHIELVASDKVRVNSEYLPVSQTYRLTFREYLGKHK